jgi:hypothetical protein
MLVHPPRLVGVELDLGPPLQVAAGEGPSTPGAVDHQLEQLVASRDVGVEAHGADPELLSDLAHRQLGGALAVGDGDAGGDDAVERQPLLRAARSAASTSRWV